jgi:hypothetical protein
MNGRYQLLPNQRATAGMTWRVGSRFAHCFGAGRGRTGLGRSEAAGAQLHDKAASRASVPRA